MDLRKIGFIAAALLAGCATSNSGVVATGADTYFVSRQSGNAMMGMANLKSEAYGEAGQFCGAKGLVPQVTQENQAKPPFVLGNYPRVELQFRCITAESRPPLSSFNK